MVKLSKHSKVEKISDDTFKDLKAIRQVIISYGTKNLPEEVQPLIMQIRETDRTTTYKGIIAVSVKFLRISIEKLIKY